MTTFSLLAALLVPLPSSAQGVAPSTAAVQALPGFAPASVSTAPAAEAPAAPPAPSPSTAAAVAPSPSPSQAREASAADQLLFLKAEADRAGEDALPALIGDVETFISRRRGAEEGPDAQLLKAQLHERLKDWAAAEVDLLKLIAEHPQSRLALPAQEKALALADKRFSRSKAVLADLAKPSDASDRGERVAAFLEKAAGLPEAFYEPLLAEVQEFARLYPDNARQDRVACALAVMHEKKGNWRAAASTDRRVLAQFPASACRVRAQSSLADIYARDLRDYPKAVEAYQAVADGFPGTPEAQTAYVQIARLLDEEEKHYSLAIEVDEKIVKLYPGTDTALKALQQEARLYRDRLSQPKDAIAALKRIAGKGYPEKAGVEALRKASDIAGSDLKDEAQQAELLKLVAATYPKSPDAAEALYDAGYIYEKDLKDNAQAAAAYKKASTDYPDSRYGKKAASHLAALK